MLLFLLIQGGLNYPRLADPTAALVGAVAAAAITPGALTSARVRLMPGWMSAALILTALCATVAGGSELQRDGNVEIAYFAAGAGGPAWRCRILPTALGVDHQRHRGHRGRCGHGAPDGSRMGHHGTGTAGGDVQPHRGGRRARGAGHDRPDEPGRVLGRGDAAEAVTTQAQLTVGGQVMAERLGRVHAGCCRSWPVSPPGTSIRPTQAHDNKPPCSRRLSGTIVDRRPFCR